MALSLAGSAEQASGASTSYVFTTATTLGHTPATGNLVVIALNLGGENGAPTAPSGWTLDRQAVTTIGTGSWWWYSRTITGSESATYTWTFPNTTRRAGAFEFTGATTWVADTGASYTGSASSVTSVGLGTSATLTSAGSVAVGALQTNSATSSFGITGGGTWTILAAGTKSFNTASLITSATTALSPTASWTTSTATTAGGFQTYYGSTQATFTGLWNVDGPTALFTGLWDVAGPVGTFQVRTEVAWETDPLTRPAEIDWTDLGTRGIKDLNIRRGTKVLSSSVEAGTAACRADNSDRELDPSNQDSTLWPNVKPRKRIRFIVSAGGTEVVLFTGFVERWPIEWALETGWVTISASDLVNIIAGLRLPPSVLDVKMRELAPVGYWPMTESTFTQQADDVIGTFDGQFTGQVAQGRQLIPYDARPCPAFQQNTNEIQTTAMYAPRPSYSDEITLLCWFAQPPVSVAGLFNPIIIELIDGSAPTSPPAGSPTAASPASIMVVIDPGSISGRHSIACRITDGTNATKLRSIVSYHVFDGKPHLAVVTIKGSTKEIKGAFDGDSPDALTTLVGGYSALSTVNVSTAMANADIIASGWGILVQNLPSVPLEGVVGHLAIFDRILTAQEVEDIWEAGTVARDGDTTRERLEWVLDQIGVDPADRDIDTGTQTCGPTTLGAQNALAYIKKLVATEQGVCFVSGDGKLTFTDRLPDSPSIVQVFSDDLTADPTGVPVGPVRPDFSWDRIINTLSVGRENGAEQPVVNQTSVDAYGPLSGATGGKLDTLHQDATEARTTGERLVERYADPRTYIPAVTLEANDDSVTLDALTAVELGDATTTKVRPAGGGDPIEQTALVEAIEHRFPQANEWTTAYSLVDYPLEP